MAVYRSTYTWNCTLKYVSPKYGGSQFSTAHRWATPDSIDPKDSGDYPAW